MAIIFSSSSATASSSKPPTSFAVTQTPRCRPALQILSQPSHHINRHTHGRRDPHHRPTFPRRLPLPLQTILRHRRKLCQLRRIRKPQGWKEKPVSKIQKGTNKNDSEFYSPKKKSEKEYLTFLNGLPWMAPKEIVLSNLALSDVNLQDLIATAKIVKSEERKDEKGQMYYVYEIDGIGAHSLIVVTCAKNKMYAHFVNAPNLEWNKDQETLRHIHE